MMSRLGFVSAKCFSLTRQHSFNVLKRTFLSEAYQCREAWENRLESPLLKKVNLSTLYQEIDWNYGESGNVNAIDADIFINANTKKGFMEDVEDLISKLRRSPDTTSTSLSTHHAAIRLLLDAGESKTLLKILNDRQKYGIYPDHYCSNLLMDKFLKEKQYSSAARVAVLQMLQEDWENPLTTRLAMYSCHMYLKNPEQTWYFEGEMEPPPPEPKEVVKVRVRFLRAPYFDDHFDLKEPMLLVGKTLSMFSSKVGGSKQLATSYNLLGLTLYQKWDQVINLANNLVKNKEPVHREALELARRALEVKAEAEESKVEEKPKSAKPDPVKEAKEAALKVELEMKQKVLDTLKGLDASAQEADLCEEMSSLVKEAVKERETVEIEQQKQLYVKWEEERVAKLKSYQEQVKKEEALKRIEQQKQELLEKEREIFFFDQEDKLDLMIESKEETLSELEKTKSNVKESKAAKDADYVPPEVFKRVKQ